MKGLQKKTSVHRPGSKNTFFIRWAAGKAQVTNLMIRNAFHL